MNMVAKRPLGDHTIEVNQQTEWLKKLLRFYKRLNSDIAKKKMAVVTNIPLYLEEQTNP